MTRLAVLAGLSLLVLLSASCGSTEPIELAPKSASVNATLAAFEAEGLELALLVSGQRGRPPLYTLREYIDVEAPLVEVAIFDDIASAEVDAGRWEDAKRAGAFDRSATLVSLANVNVTLTSDAPRELQSPVEAALRRLFPTSGEPQIR